MILSRRSLLKQTGVIIPAITLLPKFAFPAPPPANAIELLQGTQAKLGSVIANDITNINTKITPPLTSTGFFFGLTYQLQKYLPDTYPGAFSLMGISDALGHPSILVRMLPPSNMFYGSTINPSLHVLISSDTHYTNFVSMVFPDFIIHNATTPGYWRTLQIIASQLPTSPARWIISAIDINNEVFSGIKTKMGFFADPVGDAPLPSQLPPAAFNIQTTTNGIKGNVNALWLGQPITSKIGGYKPTGGPDNWLDSTPMKISQAYLNLTPTGIPNLGLTALQFVNITGVVQNLLSNISNANITAQSAEEIVNQLGNSNVATTYNAAMAKISQTRTALTAAQTAALNAGASITIQTALRSAQTYATTAANILAITPNSASAALAAVQTELDGAAEIVAATNANIVVSRPINPNTNTSLTSLIGSPPQVYLSGNNTTTTQVATGAIVAGSNNSFYQNQVTNSTSFFNPNPSTYSNTVQPPDDSYMTIESVDITPE